MLNYIENLKDEYLKTENEEKRFEIKNKLRAEKESCNRIISEYVSREKRAWINCEEIFKHENEIIERINEILNNLK